ncbi:MAG: hypothetical protein J2P27_03820 [Actinobacteria bacterium]|nr:hypothetical protein [Actinomycetota bacterium]
MQLPQWVIEFAFPAQGYARRRQRAFIDGRRRLHRLAQAKPVTADIADQAGPDDESFRARAQARRDHRIARISGIAADQEELLRAKAEVLMRNGLAQIETSDGEIAARIIRFRWGKDVIDIPRSREGQPAGWSSSSVPRSPASARMAAITFALAKALAALEPPLPS